MAEENLFGGAGADQKIDALNQILSLEYTAFHQYTQHSFLVPGLDRHDFQDYFEDQAESSYKHAKTMGNKIVAYGGVPIVEVGSIAQSTDIIKMLEQDLVLEQKLRDAYIAAIPLAEADNDVPLKFLLEQQATAEQEDVEELEKYLSLRVASAEQDGINRAAKAV